MAAFSLRHWSARHAGGLEKIYLLFSNVLIRLAPVLRLIGYSRLERPVAFLEKQVKGVLFDCQMCGQCELKNTGMTCSMNCPKNIRNGPCGGVRSDGHCEVEPDMPCVWVEAWAGSQRMTYGRNLDQVLPAVDRRYIGTSAWLRWMRSQSPGSEETKQ